ncbi:MAG: class I SAM-dependent methyltransferase, partial [Deltaproteobacteria bacterium]|nr:class I SAM-dependent methyltransferase [Deltaproteobacteria bacterium]
MLLKTTAWKHLGSALRPLRWPIELYENGIKRVNDLGLSDPISRYSLRMARYWFAASCIDAEVHRRNRIVSVVDLGCERGITKAFFGSRPNVHWIGLDWNPRYAFLAKAAYQEIRQSDFDEKLPLEDASADIVVCLHVLEHVPRPEFTISEIARILKPGGVFLGASPIMPFRFGARWRTRHFRRQLNRGKRKAGKHLNSFSVPDWLSLMKQAGLHPDTICGGYLLRCKTNPLESFSFWVRSNRLWGLLFPSFGCELFVQARRPDRAAPLHEPVLHRPFLGAQRTAWVSVTVAALFTASLWCMGREGGIQGELVRHQDGNDRFYVCRQLQQRTQLSLEWLNTLEEQSHIPAILAADRYDFLDSHFLVDAKDLERISKQ